VAALLAVVVIFAIGAPAAQGQYTGQQQAPSGVYLPYPSPMWTDSPVQILQMKFDHQGPYPESASDAIDICYDLGTLGPEDLEHMGMGLGNGEFDTEDGFNEPAVWVQSTEGVEIKVRFKVNLALIPNGVPYLAKAKIKATVTAGTWINVAETDVYFDHTTQYSKEGNSEYVSMFLGGPAAKMPSGLNYEHVTWSWSMREQVFIDGTQLSPEVQLGTSQHQFFTIFGSPLAPWYRYPSQPAPVNLIRILLGDSATYVSGGYGLRGTLYIPDASDTLVDKLFTRAGRKFCHSERVPPATIDSLELSSAKRASPEVFLAGTWSTSIRWRESTGKIRVQSAEWVTATEQNPQLWMAMRLLGVQVGLHRADPFGYVNDKVFVGDTSETTNHVFWRDTTRTSLSTKSVDLSAWSAAPNTLKRHMKHFNHMVWMEDVNVYDCLAGPVKGTPRSSYFTDFRNTTSPLPTGVCVPLQAMVSLVPIPIADSDEISVPIIHTPWASASSATYVNIHDLRLMPFGSERKSRE
jgi:hypothetical protein